MSDNLIFVIVAVAFFFWYRMQQAMTAALCQGAGISSGCGPSGLILGGMKIVVPGFGIAPACSGRGASSIFCCSTTRQGYINKNPVGGGTIVLPTPFGCRPSSVQPRPVTTPVMGMASQSTTLPKPIATHPAPLTINPCRPTPALCSYNNLSATPGKVITSTVSGPIGLAINNLTECFCKVDKLYGKALVQGVAAGKIAPNFPTPAAARASFVRSVSPGYGPRATAARCAP